MAISMTGFGSAEERWETWTCQAEIRSVNHRYLDIHCRLPAGFQVLEQDCKKQLKQFVPGENRLFNQIGNRFRRSKT